MATFLRNFKPFEKNPDYYNVRVYNVYDVIYEQIETYLYNACFAFYGLLNKYNNNPNIKVAIYAYDENGNEIGELVNDVTEAAKMKCISIIDTKALVHTKVSAYEVIMEEIEKSNAELIFESTDFNLFADTKTNRVFVVSETRSNLVYHFPSPSQFISNHSFWCELLTSQKGVNALKYWIFSNKGNQQIGQVSPRRWEYTAEMFKMMVENTVDHYVEAVYGQIQFTHPKMANEVLFSVSVSQMKFNFE